MSKIEKVVQIVLDVYIENSGRKLLYPSNEPAKLLVSLMGKRCLDEKHLDTVKKLGFKVMQVPNPRLQETREL